MAKKRAHKPFFRTPEENITDVFSLFCLNIQSIRNKTNQLAIYLNDCKALPDVLCFSEHWLCKNELQFFNIVGYTLGASFCRQEGKHGGVMIMLRDNVKFTEIPDISLMSVPLHCEVCGIRVRQSGIFIISLYRAPTGDMSVFYGVLDKLFDFLKVTKSKIILCGDFNILFNIRNKITVNVCDFFRSLGYK